MVKYINDKTGYIYTIIDGVIHVEDGHGGWSPRPQLTKWFLTYHCQVK